MVSLVDIYNIKEVSFSELKKDGDPARGNKGKTDARDHYLVHGDPDPETGAIKSTVVYKRSFERMVADLEAETIDMRKLSEDNPDDIVLHNVFIELKDIFNKFKTHVRKNYPEAKGVNEAFQKDGHIYNHEEVGEYGAMQPHATMEMALVGEEGILGNDGVFISWGDIERFKNKYNKYNK